MELVEEIRTIAEEKLKDGQFLVEVIVSSNKGPRKITVIVDGDQGFGIDDCAEISRHVSKVMDDRNLIDDNYFLEVSTPGVDHSLKLKRQYFKHIGRRLKLKMKEGNVEGKLTSVHENSITIERETGAGKKKETETLEVPMPDIQQAFVMVSFK